jgi:hypothetical protein
MVVRDRESLRADEKDYFHPGFHRMLGLKIQHGYAVRILVIVVPDGQGEVYSKDADTRAQGILGSDLRQERVGPRGGVGVVLTYSVTKRAHFRPLKELLESTSSSI